MPSFLITSLLPVYKSLPAGWRAPVRDAYLWGSLRLESAKSRRRIENGRRIEFLDFEIAHLEDYAFLGAGPNDVVVDAKASCVSPGTERAVLCGLPGARRPFPYAPGYSSAGVVASAGPESGFKPGDRVAGRMSHASKGVMTSSSLFRVPDKVSDESASFIELGIICLQGVRKAAIRPGERVAVIGQGLIGQLAGRLARIAGAQPITAVASSRRRAETAMRGGAADTFVGVSDGAQALAEIEADVVIEAVGSASAVASAIQVARRGGRVVLLGSSRDLGRNLDWWAMAQDRDIGLIGAHIGALPQRDTSTSRRTYEQEGHLFMELLDRGALDVTGLVTWRPGPQECNAVYEALAGGGGAHVGIVFDWSGRAGTGSRA